MTSSVVSLEFVHVFNAHLSMSKLSLSQCLKVLCRRVASSFRKQKPEPTVSRVPVEIFLQIFSYLPLPSQVCLALSCKGLYQHFGSVLEADSLQFPRWSPMRKKYLGTEEYHQRMGLLLQLEDSRWACCAGCYIHGKSFVGTY